MFDNISLSFLLCTLHRDDYFERSIRSLFETEHHNIRFEVIVVDQGLSKSVEKICLSLGATYISTESRGLSLARNIGLQKCEGQFIALMDDDAYISDTYFKEYRAIIQQESTNNLDAFCGRILTIENPLKPFSRTQGVNVAEVSYGNVNVILSSALVIRKIAFGRVGNFDEDLGVGARWGGSEETDFICRLINGGGDVKYFPSLRIFHPEVNYKSMRLREIIHKSYTYSLGRGAMLRKNRYLPLSFTIKALVIPVGGFVLSIALCRPKLAVKFVYTFLGRVRGWLCY